MEKYIFSSLIGSLIALTALGNGASSPFFLGLLSVLVCIAVFVGLNKLFG